MMLLLAGDGTVSSWWAGAEQVRSRRRRHAMDQQGRCDNLLGSMKELREVGPSVLCSIDLRT